MLNKGFRASLHSQHVSKHSQGHMCKHTHRRAFEASSVSPTTEFFPTQSHRIYFCIPVRLAAKNRASVKRGNNCCAIPRVFSLPYLKTIAQQVQQRIQNNRTASHTAMHCSRELNWVHLKVAVTCCLLSKCFLIYYSPGDWKNLPHHLVQPHHFTDEELGR